MPTEEHNPYAASKSSEPTSKGPGALATLFIFLVSLAAGGCMFVCTCAGFGLATFNFLQDLTIPVAMLVGMTCGIWILLRTSSGLTKLFTPKNPQPETPATTNPDSGETPDA